MIVSLFGLALLAVNQPAGRPLPQSMSGILECRRLSDAERLRCFDRAVATLDTAVTSGAVAIVERQEIQRTRRSLFGLRLPAIPLYGGSNDTEQASIDTTIRSARPFDRDKWLLVLADGAVWQTTEGDTRSLAPRPGEPVTIRRGSLGSYILKWRDGRSQRAIRVS